MIFNIHIKKSKSIPLTLTFSQDGEHFVVTGSDRQIRIFKTRSCKIHRKYDESLQAVADLRQLHGASASLDDMEFGRRLALEKELDKTISLYGRSGIAMSNVIFDQSGHFLIHATLVGIKGMSSIFDERDKYDAN